MGVYGVAARQGDHWVFSENMKSKDPNEPCLIKIELLPNNGVRVTSDPVAACHSEGGYGTQIGTVRFSKRDLIGPVADEFDTDSYEQFGIRCP
jgi:hypothetical protein